LIGGTLCVVGQILFERDEADDAENPCPFCGGWSNPDRVGTIRALVKLAKKRRDSYL
jgi:hypothetical protein